MKQLQHSYYFWKTPRKNKTVRKAKGGRQKGEVVGVDDQCKEHKEWQKFFILEYKKQMPLFWY